MQIIHLVLIGISIHLFLKLINNILLFNLIKDINILLNIKKCSYNIFVKLKIIMYNINLNIFYNF